jgi:hypothetical protein
MPANMPLATAAIERPIEFTIGTGLMAIPEIDPEEVGMTPDALAPIIKRMRVDYDEYMASKDPDAEQSSTGYALQEITMRAEMTGDMLGPRDARGQRGRRSTTAWKMYEAIGWCRRIGHTEGLKLSSGPYAGQVCIAGVVQDGYGEPIAFSVLKRDPGSFNVRMADDTSSISRPGAKDRPADRVPGRAEKARQPDARVPFLAPVLDIIQKADR